MVRKIEKLRTKFQIRLLRGMEELEYGEVPFFVSRRLDSIAANVAKGTRRWIGECAGVEPRARRANPGGRNTGSVGLPGTGPARVGSPT